MSRSFALLIVALAAILVALLLRTLAPISSTPLPAIQHVTAADDQQTGRADPLPESLVRREEADQRPARESLALEPEEAIPSQVEKAAPAFIEAAGGPEDWELEYERAGWEDLLEESRRIRAYITAEAKDDLARRYELGIYDVIPGEDGRLLLDRDFVDSFHEGLCIVVTTHEKELRRYEVGEREYPDLYELSRKARWLKQEGTNRRRRSPGFGFLGGQ